MKQYEEIKDIIVNQLGIKDQETYLAYIQSIHNGREITQEELDLLSPDNINNSDFWKVVEELFGTDCVANTNHGKLSSDVVAGNRRNIAMSNLIGTMNIIYEYKHFGCPILEIGAGYGSLKNYIEVNTAMSYTGVDVYPKIPGVIKATPEGFLPEEVKANKYLLFYASNVFQHLSSKQRSQYFSDIQGMMLEGAAFSFNMLCHLGEPDKKKHKTPDGLPYLRHYGQFTVIPNLYEIRDELQKHFYILSETRRVMDNLFGFQCLKKQEPEPEMKKETLTPEQTATTVVPDAG